MKAKSTSKARFYLERDFVPIRFKDVIRDKIRRLMQATENVYVCVCFSLPSRI